MKYKEFFDWCAVRAKDGRWSGADAFECIEILEILRTTPFWRRKYWWGILSHTAQEIVDRTDAKIREAMEEKDHEP